MEVGRHWSGRRVRVYVVAIEESQRNASELSKGTTDEPTAYRFNAFAVGPFAF